MSVKLQLIDRIKWSMSLTIRPTTRFQLTEIATAHSDVIQWLVEQMTELMTKKKTFTYKHDSFRNVVWLYQRIFVQPQLLWLNHSLKRFQELCESVKENRNASEIVWVGLYSGVIRLSAVLSHGHYTQMSALKVLIPGWMQEKNSAPMNKLVFSCCSSISILGLCWGLPGHPGICRTWPWFLSSQQNLFWHLFHTPYVRYCMSPRATNI